MRRHRRWLFIFGAWTLAAVTYAALQYLGAVEASIDACVPNMILQPLVENAVRHAVAARARGGRIEIRARREEGEMLRMEVRDDGEGMIEGGAPNIKFLTAYDQYALRAFDVHALDYLLKPYTGERFRLALGRARAFLSRAPEGEADGRLVSLIESLGREQKYLEWLTVKSPGRVFFLRVSEVEWVEAEGNYLRLHAGGEAHMLRETLNALASKLDPREFLRIHRSTLVNVKNVKEFRPTPSGDYEVIMRDDTRLTLSRGYREKVLDSFQS